MARIKPLIVSVALTLGVGALAALLTQGSTEIYGMLVQPPLSPPGWVFPVVWTVLYLLMGVAAGLVWNTEDPGRERALGLYILQLVFNFFWPLLFFGAERFGLALLWLAALLVLVLLTVRRFFEQDQRAGWLMVPYLAWTVFALYLNAGVWYLNR